MIIFFIFLASFGRNLAQVKLYGNYVAGEKKETVDKYERLMRLNGLYYYIEPHFDESNQLYKLRIINYDYVTLSDYHVVLQHAERLTELMEHQFGAAIIDVDDSQPVYCDENKPVLIASWRNKEKDIQINIQCKDGHYYHIVLTISAYPEKSQALFKVSSGN